MSCNTNVRRTQSSRHRSPGGCIGGGGSARRSPQSWAGVRVTDKRVKQRVNSIKIARANVSSLRGSRAPRSRCRGCIARIEQRCLHHRNGHPLLRRWYCHHRHNSTCLSTMLGSVAVEAALAGEMEAEEV